MLTKNLRSRYSSLRSDIVIWYLSSCERNREFQTLSAAGSHVPAILTLQEVENQYQEVRLRGTHLLNQSYLPSKEGREEFYTAHAGLREVHALRMVWYNSRVCIAALPGPKHLPNGLFYVFL